MTVRITALVDPQARASGHGLAWLASDQDGVPTGSAFMHVFTRAQQVHLALLELNIHPAERDGDSGRLLLEAVVAAARSHDRRRIITHVRAGSPGEACLAEYGFHRVLTLVSTRLALSGTDITALEDVVARGRAGYRLESWDGMVPGRLEGTFLASRRAMDDTPTGGLDLAAVPWDTARLRAMAESVERNGDVLHTVVAVDARETIAGYTELAVPVSGTGNAVHYGTAVLPGHRGRGLGLWMKAESIRQVRVRYPDLDGLLADTADGNTHMERVNAELGYQQTHTTHEYRFEL
jgi:GNAT superfamily N-acetyltransferase